MKRIIAAFLSMAIFLALVPRTVVSVRAEESDNENLLLEYSWEINEQYIVKRVLLIYKDYNEDASTTSLIFELKEVTPFMGTDDEVRMSKRYTTTQSCKSEGKPLSVREMCEKDKNLKNNDVYSKILVICDYYVISSGMNVNASACEIKDEFIDEISPDLKEELFDTIWDLVKSKLGIETPIIDFLLEVESVSESAKKFGQLIMTFVESLFEMMENAFKLLDENDDSPVVAANELFNIIDSISD